MVEVGRDLWRLSGHLCQTSASVRLEPGPLKLREWIVLRWKYQLKEWTKQTLSRYGIPCTESRYKQNLSWCSSHTVLAFRSAVLVPWEKGRLQPALHTLTTRKKLGHAENLHRLERWKKFHTASAIKRVWFAFWGFQEVANNKQTSKKVVWRVSERDIKRNQCKHLF